MSSHSSFSGFGYAKALIFGEYAVMHGAPALALALSPALNLTLSFTQYSESPFKQDPFCSTLANLLKQKFGFLPVIDINNSAFFDKLGHKLGIGSSAAAVAALAYAVNQMHHCDCFPSIPRLSIVDAIDFHRALQNNMGSGIDVIASIMGGAICAQNCPHHPEIQRIQLENLPAIAILATHQQAPTKSFIAAAKKVENTIPYKRTIDALSEIYSSLAATISLPGKKDSFLEQISTITALLRQLGSIIDMPIVPDIVDNLADLARDCGVILKSSGAGGGDILIAMALRQNNLQVFLENSPDSLTPLNVSIAPERCFE